MYDLPESDRKRESISVTNYMNSLNRDGEWEEEFNKRFVLDPAEVFFGNREELKKQGWIVGASKLIIKQDTTPEQLKYFIHTLLEEAKASERKRCLEALPNKKQKEDTSFHIIDDYACVDYGFNQAIDQAISAITNKK